MLRCNEHVARMKDPRIAYVSFVGNLYMWPLEDRRCHEIIICIWILGENLWCWKVN